MMKKFLLLMTTAVAVTLMSVPMAFAVPSPTEPDRPPVEIQDPDVPMAEDPVMIPDPDVPMAEDPVMIADPDVPLAEAPVDIGDPDVPLGEAPVDIDDPDVPLGELPVDIEDPDVPLAFVPAPQTGVTGLSGMEALTLAAMASALCGVLMLAKAWKQTGSVR